MVYGTLRSYLVSKRHRRLQEVVVTRDNGADQANLPGFGGYKQSWNDQRINSQGRRPPLKNLPVRATSRTNDSFPDAMLGATAQQRNVHVFNQ